MSRESRKGGIPNRLRKSLIRAGYHSRPRFLIIGAQKAGTTALYYYLSEHPRIIPSLEKEIGFFSPEVFADWPEHPNHHVLCGRKGSDYFDPKSYHKLESWYHSHFPLPHQLGINRITFEATPEYLYYPGAVERIYKYDPQMKLIVILRDPVERAYSAWSMYHSFDTDGYRPLIYAPRRESREFEVAVYEEIEDIHSGRTIHGPGYVRRGIYYEQLIRYLNLFTREQILILDSGELKSDTSGVVRQVIKFLELPNSKQERGWPAWHVGRYKTQITDTAHHLLSEFYKPYNEKLIQLLDREFDWS